MKKTRILVIALAVLMVFAAVSCEEEPVHSHVYSSPYVDGDKVVQKCECGDVKVVEDAVVVGSAEDFEKQIADGSKTVYLKDDITFGNAEERIVGLAFEKDIEINLNEKTLKVYLQKGVKDTFNGVFKISADVVFSNGKLDFDSESKGSVQSVVYAVADSSLSLKDVALVSNASGILPGGKSTVVVDHSTVTAVIWPVATNNTYGTDFDVSIINGSVITANAEDCDNTGLMINNKGKLTVKDSTIIGDRQVVIVRGGTAEFENVVLEMKKIYKDDNSNVWDSGNNLPRGVLVIGNAGGSPYDLSLIHI